MHIFLDCHRFLWLFKWLSLILFWNSCTRYFLGWTTSFPWKIGTWTYFQNFTYLLNRKLFLARAHERKFFLSLVEKMLIAFFNISRSMVTSRNSRLGAASFFSASICFRLPFPGKAMSLFSRYWLLQIDSYCGEIPSSSATSFTLFRAKLNSSQLISTAFILKVL